MTCVETIFSYLVPGVIVGLISTFIYVVYSYYRKEKKKRKTKRFYILVSSIMCLKLYYFFILAKITMASCPF